jgi:glycine cleavage system H protein
MAQRPNNVRYSKTHEWVRLEGTTATIGITDLAVELLGELVFVDFPVAKGKKVERDANVAAVESVKAVGDVLSPVAGEVLEVNAGLSNDQSPLAKDPFGAGWMLKLKVAAGTKLADLMDAAAYQAFLDAGGAEH